MATSVEYVDAVRRQQRAARHTVSLTLGVHGLAVAVLAVAHSRLVWHMNLFALVVPSVVYFSLWLATRWRRRLTGIGAGHEGFGIMALVSLLLVVLFPVSYVALLFVGAGAFLGVGLAVLGARQHEPRLWLPAIALLILSPLVSNSTFDNMVYDSHDLQPGTIVLAVLAAGLLALAGVTYRAERAEMREVPTL